MTGPTGAAVFDPASDTASDARGDATSGNRKSGRDDAGLCMPSDKWSIVDLTLSGIDASPSNCASIASSMPAGSLVFCCGAGFSTFARVGALPRPPLLLILTPGANSLVDDVLPDHFGLTGFLTKPLPGPSADDPPLLAGELSPRLAVEVTPDDALAGLDADDSDEDVPVASAAAMP